MRAVILAAVVLAVALGACSTDSDDGTAWCSAFAGFTLAGIEYESATPGTASQETAYQQFETAFAAMVEAEPPPSIADDYELLKVGPDPAEAGASWYASIERISDWVIDNCGYSDELIDLLQSE